MIPTCVFPATLQVWDNTPEGAVNPVAGTGSPLIKAGQLQRSHVSVLHGSNKTNAYVTSAVRLPALLHGNGWAGRGRCIVLEVPSRLTCRCLAARPIAQQYSACSPPGTRQWAVWKTIQSGLEAHMASICDAERDVRSLRRAWTCRPRCTTPSPAGSTSTPA